VRSLGIDVGVRKGLDLVVLERDRLEPRAWRVPVRTGDGRIRIPELGPAIRDAKPDVVAIDSPPGWARRGSSRQTEREIRHFGIQSYGTPTRDRGIDHAFYEWMRVGFEAFRVAERCGYPRFGRGEVRGSAIEVFPHATAVVLAGCLPPQGSSKRLWRMRVLRGAGVGLDGLRSTDQVDATLAALTGLYALAGRTTALGDPTEGVIVLPARTLPSRPFRRCRTEGSLESQPRLRGMSPCACGDPACTRLTAREFAPGHDAKRKSALWTAAREGHDALDELRRRGWELPPEMR
jgi:predicted nuclease with RNAse H fold